ncbi:MAG: 4-alpha-glucanotransferase, partial [Methylotenera sp.]|nr:4-alpha-glucanotransferase [Methylotenera sp.]
NSVAYTGTHDNDTTLGWYNALDEQQREMVDAYIRSSHSEKHELSMPADLIAMVFESNSQLAIIPMQDLLALDSTHRMNTPGTCTGNWHWRFNWLQLSASQAKSIAEVIARTGRH